jgi:hypothetical protein
LAIKKNMVLKERVDVEEKNVREWILGWGSIATEVGYQPHN